MAKITKTGSDVNYETMLDNAKSQLSKTASVVAGSTITKNVIGTEGFSGPEHMESRLKTQGELEASVDKLFVGVGTESLTAAQREAGAIVMAAASDPISYAAAAMDEAMPALGKGDVDASVVLSGAAGTYDGDAQSIGMEYFNDSEVLTKNMGASLVFNVQASRQDEFCEAFFPTIVADPTEAGLLIEYKKTVVHRAVRHALKKEDQRDFNRRNILDAASDHTVLEDDAIALVPYMAEDGRFDAEFMPADLKEPTSRQVGDYSVRTNPLKLTGAPRKMLSLSAHPGLVGSGFLDESDDIAGRVTLKAIYVRIRKVGTTTDEIIKFNTANLPRSSFNPSAEGDAMEMDLNFRNAVFSLNAGTKTLKGTAPAALEAIAAGGYNLKFTTSIRASLNLQTGEEHAHVATTNIVGLYDEANDGIDHTNGTGKTLVDGIEFAVEYIDYEMYRSNANRRTKGLLIDSMATRERFKIMLGSPLTSRKPIGRTDNTQAVADLVTAARMRNSNQGVTKLLNYSEQLKEVVQTITNEYDLVSIEGVGRHYIRPWFEEVDFVPSQILSNTDSMNKEENLRKGVLTTLREQVARAYQESRFQPAIEMLSGYTMTKPDVLIGTDPYTAQWLWESGDVRTLGNQFQYRIVTTVDARFRGRIQWVFTVSAGDNGLSPLNFGNHLWIPELITDTNLTRNEGTANEVTVQPRNLHIVHCPITGVVNLMAVRDYISTKPALNVTVVGDTGAAVGDNVLDGLDPEA